MSHKHTRRQKTKKVPSILAAEASSSSNGTEDPKQQGGNLDLSGDHHHPRYLAEARSTPIMYSAASLHSTLSSSSSLGYRERKVVADDSNRSFCSAHSFTAASANAANAAAAAAAAASDADHFNPREVISSTSSTRNQVFYFGTPLPRQKQQPYQYHGPQSAHYYDESDTPKPQHWIKKKKDIFLQSNTNRRLSVSGASMRSAFSAGRQTIRSWRQKRIHVLKKQQTLPDFETKAFCDCCEKYIQTRIRYLNGSMVWLMSFILLMCTVILFWVPFYAKYFKDVAHYCPGCGRRLGVSYRL